MVVRVITMSNAIKMGFREWTAPNVSNAGEHGSRVVVTVDPFLAIIHSLINDNDHPNIVFLKGFKAISEVA